MAIKRRKNSKHEESTAYHEAGHAIAAIVIERPFRYVTIEPEDGALGHVLHHPWGNNFHPDWEMNGRIRMRLERAVLTLLAGSRAEKRLTGRWNNRGARDDFHKAANLASYFAGEGKMLEAYLRWMNLRAEALVDQPLNWRAIQALATALLSQRRITYKKARQIFIDATAPRNIPWSGITIRRARGKELPRQ